MGLKYLLMLHLSESCRGSGRNSGHRDSASLGYWLLSTPLPLDIRRSMVSAFLVLLVLYQIKTCLWALDGAKHYSVRLTHSQW